MAAPVVAIGCFLFLPISSSTLIMKTIKFFAATACAFCLSTAAFAQTTPSGTMQGGTMQNGTSTGNMNNGTMTTPSQTGTGTDRMQSGTMNNGTTGGRMNGKSKMNGSKGTKKSKMSTTPSSTGTM